MEQTVGIIGAGLAGSEAALQLARCGMQVCLFECRPNQSTPVHKTDYCAELVCSNSLKSENPTSCAGMLKAELQGLHSQLYAQALQCRVSAGGALAVDRQEFATGVTHAIQAHPHIQLVRAHVVSISPDGFCRTEDGETYGPFSACLVASGPLTTNKLALWIQQATHKENLSFYDAAAPIVLASSLDHSRIFRQSRYSEGVGDYLNAPFEKEDYAAFVAELAQAQRVIAKDFESKDLFQACQPIEEIARKDENAPRFGSLKPVGLVNPATGKRPWAALQLRAEDAFEQSYNLVGFQTNLTFPEQERVFRMIPGLQHAEFCRFGVMHRNTFIDAPAVMNVQQQLRPHLNTGAMPIYFAGQISGTEGYCEAIRSGLQAAIEMFYYLSEKTSPSLPAVSAYGALLHYATSTSTQNYQPMHVNFGIMPPLNETIRNKDKRRQAYAQRAQRQFSEYCAKLIQDGFLFE